MRRPALVARLIVAVIAVAVATIATSAAIPVSATLQAQSDQIYKPGKDVTLPEVVTEVKPRYTPEALQAKIQGTVWLRVVVLANGNVADVTVINSLDSEHGLDQQAVDAARQWKFKPGTKDGKPVAVEVTLEMTFTLKK